MKYIVTAFVCNVESSSVLQKRTRKIIFANVSSCVIHKAHYQGRLVSLYPLANISLMVCSLLHNM